MAVFYIIPSVTYGNTTSSYKIWLKNNFVLEIILFCNLRVASTWLNEKTFLAISIREPNVMFYLFSFKSLHKSSGNSFSGINKAKWWMDDCLWFKIFFALRYFLLVKHNALELQIANGKWHSSFYSTFPGYRGIRSIKIFYRPSNS